MWQREGDSWHGWLGDKELWVRPIAGNRWAGYVTIGEDHFKYDGTWRTADKAKAAIVALELYKEQG